MKKYFYYWIFFLAVESIRHGYINYKAIRKESHFDSTGKMIKYYGGLWESITCTFVSALGLLVSPVFLGIETLKFIPIGMVIYCCHILINK